MFSKVFHNEAVRVILLEAVCEKHRKDGSTSLHAKCQINDVGATFADLRKGRLADLSYVDNLFRVNSGNRHMDKRIDRWEQSKLR